MLQSGNAEFFDVSELRFFGVIFFLLSWWAYLNFLWFLERKVTEMTSRHCTRKKLLFGWKIFELKKKKQNLCIEVNDLQFAFSFNWPLISKIKLESFLSVSSHPNLLDFLSSFFFSSTTKKRKKISRIISDKEFSDVFFLFCDLGSVLKFCYLFWGIVTVVGF